MDALERRQAVHKQCVLTNGLAIRRTDSGIITKCKSSVQAVFSRTPGTIARASYLAMDSMNGSWRGTPKQPYRFLLKSEQLFWFAGLWQPAKVKKRGAPSEFIECR